MACRLLVIACSLLALPLLSKSAAALRGGVAHNSKRRCWTAGYSPPGVVGCEGWEDPPDSPATVAATPRCSSLPPDESRAAPVVAARSTPGDRVSSPPPRPVPVCPSLQ